MTWIALGVGYLLICLPIHALALRGPKRNGDPKRNKTSDPQWPQLTGRARHQGMLWMIVSFVCSGYLMGAVMTLWVTNVQDFGHSATMAAAAGAVIGPFKTVGRFLEMLASRALYPMATYALSLSLMLSGFGVLLVFGLTVPGLMIAAALYGMGDGLMTISRATMPLPCLAARATARLGWISFAQMSANASAPFVFAWITEAFGAWWSFAAMAFCLCLALAFFLLIPDPRRQTQDDSAEDRRLPET